MDHHHLNPPHPWLNQNPNHTLNHNINHNHNHSSLHHQLSHLSLAPSPVGPTFNFPLSDDPWDPLPRQTTSSNMDELRVLSGSIRPHHHHHHTQTQPPPGPWGLGSGLGGGLESVVNRRVLSCSDLFNQNNNNGRRGMVGFSSNPTRTHNRVGSGYDQLDMNVLQHLFSRMDSNNNNNNNNGVNGSSRMIGSTNHNNNNNNYIHRVSTNGGGGNARARGSSVHGQGHNGNSTTSWMMGGILLDMELESWEELKGKVATYAKDQLWSRKLQATLNKLPRDGIKLVVSETKDDYKEIMYNQFGTHFFQALMDFCDDNDITDLLAVVMSSQDFLHICFDDHGTRALQKLVKKLDKKNGDQRSIVTSTLRGVTLTLSKDTAGHHVLEEFLKAFDGANDVIEPIMEEIVTHCLDIAMDRSGCCLLQKCVKYVQGETGQHLLRQIISYAFELSEHTFGNYVVQYILEMRNYQYTRDIMVKLKGKFAYLSKNKFGSHVVEKCLEVGSDDQVAQIIMEMVDDPDFVEILQDNFGNYVAQSAHKRACTSQGLRAVCQVLESRIQSNYPFLHSHLHGKRVLSRIKHSNKYHV